jgi:hypothetical protein
MWRDVLCDQETSLSGEVIARAGPQSQIPPLSCCVLRHSNETGQQSLHNVIVSNLTLFPLFPQQIIIIVIIIVILITFTQSIYNYILLLSLLLFLLRVQFMEIGCQGVRK